MLFSGNFIAAQVEQMFVFKHLTDLKSNIEKVIYPQVQISYVSNSYIVRKFEFKDFLK